MRGSQEPVISYMIHTGNEQEKKSETPRLYFTANFLSTVKQPGFIKISLVFSYENIL
jgi:hypothetical protein